MTFKLDFIDRHGVFVLILKFIALVKMFCDKWMCSNIRVYSTSDLRLNCQILCQTALFLNRSTPVNPYHSFEFYVCMPRLYAYLGGFMNLSKTKLKLKLNSIVLYKSKPTSNFDLTETIRFKRIKVENSTSKTAEFCCFAESPLSTQG